MSLTEVFASALLISLVAIMLIHLIETLVTRRRPISRTLSEVLSEVRSSSNSQYHQGTGMSFIKSYDKEFHLHEHDTVRGGDLDRFARLVDAELKRLESTIAVKRETVDPSTLVPTEEERKQN